MVLNLLVIYLQMTACCTVKLIPSTTLKSDRTMYYAKENWANKWFMEINPIKCIVLTITHKVNPVHTSYSLYGQELNHASTSIAS